MIATLPLCLVIFILICLGYVLFWAYHDFCAFLALGLGGTPQTLLGWTKLKVLYLFRLRNTFAPPRIPRSLRRQEGYLSRRVMPQRVGPRPILAGLAPHRQIDSFGGLAAHERLIAAVAELPGSDMRLAVSISPFEKHSEALVVLEPARNLKKGGEVCHVHPTDGSLHLTLHPADVALCIENGWAERHPLARGGWMERFVPETFVLVYAPRTDLEVQTVLDIVAASVWWVAGDDQRTKGEGSLEKLLIS